MTKTWRLNTRQPQKEQLISSQQGIPLLNAKILVNRGITDPESVESFLFPRLAMLVDPMLMQDMDKALDLVLHAIDNGEPITIYGDYDADGITATALLLRFFSELGIHASSYIPDRLNEGYSLNPNAINHIAGRGGLVITVDCGISNPKEIRLAHDVGLKIIITDHHQIPEDFKAICPIINPNRHDSMFPFKQLAGVGVAFFLAVAIRGALRRRGDFKVKEEPDLRQYLDLVALGSIADMVPLIGQNRILVKSGIEVMKNSRWPGVTAMINASGVNSHDLTSSDIAYRLAPRLNAPGRMGDPFLGLKILMENDPVRADGLAQKLNSINDQRQTIEGEILDLIEKRLIPEMDFSKKRTIVIWNRGWHKGVLGIVASRILDRYHRPTLVITVQDNMAVGSGRSIDGLNLHKALSKMGHLLERFGGHYHAAGLTLRPEYIEDLEKGLEEIALDEMNDEDLIPSIDVDAQVILGEMGYETIRGIYDLAPFGTGNPEPVFWVRQLKVISSRIVGEKHLKLRISDGDKTMDAIGFHLSEHQPLEGERIDMLFTPEIDKWQGFEKVQLRMIDLRSCD